MKRAVFAFLLVVAAALAGVAFFGAGTASATVVVVVPYAALAIFLVGLTWRVIRWSMAPVPFRIPSVCGQQKSLPWIRTNKLDSPSTTLGVIGRMALEVLLFRSLFRNTRSRMADHGARLIHGEAKWLWLGALAFHWSLLVVLLRHLRFFVEPTPAIAAWLDHIDGFFQVSAPVIYASDLVLLLGLLYLVKRRFADPQVHYISLLTDYFALFLLLGIAGTGVWMRYIARVDAVAVKQFALSLAVFAPVVPKTLSPLFFAHLALVSTLAAYFPFSKLVHMGGVFLSPTRNLANNNRAKRHINPWNPPVKVHSYQEWEEEFHDKIVAAGLPVEKA